MPRCGKKGPQARRTIPSLAQSAALSALAGLKLPKDIRISPDGLKLTVSSLWIADVGVDHSARQITSGLFRDEKPRWSPDGRYIAFLSDRGSGSSVIYLLGIDVRGGWKDFEWSADGRHIAFIPKDGDDDAKEVDADEQLVFGGDEGSSNQRLRVVDVERRTVRTLTPADQNVALFSWSPNPNSTEIAYTLSNPSLSQSSSSQISSSSLVWAQPERLHFIARPTLPYTQPSVYEARIKSKKYGSYFGWSGEAISLHGARDSVIARVQNPTHESAHALGVANDFTLVLARSSPQVANEVWSVTKERKSRGPVKLSSHNTAFDGFRSKRISTTGPDGWECDGRLFTPKPVSRTRRLPPTVVLVRSQPTLPSFSMGPHLDVAYPTTAGYAVLCPNIRPNVGGGIAERYADVLAILKKAVEENLVDESRITISGWADGGFLSSLALIRNEFSFRAVVCGGCILDWDFVNANSDPSSPGPDAAEDKDDGYVSGEEYLNGGIEKKNTPLLILHSQEDDQVPVSGPLAFWRQRHRWNRPVQMHSVDLWTRVLGLYERHLA
ncbi:Alpha/Beta hydrolase protein [Aspergillus fruticulosus]